jgi:hypothetical protein
MFSATVGFEIRVNDSLSDMQNNFVSAIHDGGDSSFSWSNSLTIIQKFLLNMQFTFFRNTLIDNNIFKIQNKNSKTIFGIDGNGFLNWRFYNNSSFGNEKNRFVI